MSKVTKPLVNIEQIFPLDIECLFISDNQSEIDPLSQLALISITDPGPKTRLAAISGLHWRYTPQIRKVYTVDNLLRIEVKNSDGSTIPHYVGFVPDEYLTEKTELYCWDLDKN